ncbi:lysM and putative peptidoglycan-binding domain-containing protein 1 [Bombina bombina]|uniref:lysM and putative peptidoglycan-binding domain-containing protein 1 n=1 Tax=Bombina bombina TaxID=8345 RepID=UPI00235ABC49|nr:lysM and putative peptidoglycan-binding domain-containing protein 1 [Bombina bombina]
MAFVPGQKNNSGGPGLLCGARARSYGSVVQSSYSPARIKKVEHHVQPGDTLQGLALKYGVTMEQIKRANRLYTNDSIFLKKSLCIPILVDQPELSNGMESHPGSGQERLKEEETITQPEKGDREKIQHHSSSVSTSQKKEISASDYLNKLDTKIRVSKRAAVKKLREGESICQEAETNDPTGGAGYQGSHTDCSRAESPRTQQRTLLGPVPLTVTTRASTLRDHEDEIFKL